MRLLRAIALFLFAVAVAAGTGIADEPDNAERLRLEIGPIQFRTAAGGVFYPRRIIIRTSGGTLGAELPAAGFTARSEDRIDLSGIPLLGALFPPRLSPDDVRGHERLGPVYRDGHALYLDAVNWPDGLTGAPYILATDVPRAGAVSYDVGRLAFRPSDALLPASPPIGHGFLVGDHVVLASGGGEPGRPSIEAMIEDLL